MGWERGNEKCKGVKKEMRNTNVGMAMCARLVVSLPLLYLSLPIWLPMGAVAIKKSYVVYLGGHSHGVGATSVDYERATDFHHELLAPVVGSVEKAKDAMFYSYTRHINGFAAMLEEEEAMEVSKHPKVLSIFPNEARELHTTRSWSFLGLEKNGKIPRRSLWRKAGFGENVIIGSLDTGVWPESESFNDKGMGPIPSRWRGICQNDTHDGVQCNRKLIGIRYFKKSYMASGHSLNATARDYTGHGTHTLSTAGGRFVPGVSVLGLGEGTAKGGAPNARLAAYKVCWPQVEGRSCFDADIIAAFDAAIYDGVDVLSVSLGGEPTPFSRDGIAIGSFHAVKSGIPVVCSAGNGGGPGSVGNTAPWIFTVGASTMDRRFSSNVLLGNNQLLGVSLTNTVLPAAKFYPLINSLDAKVDNAAEYQAQFCGRGSLDPHKIRGKIVVCFGGLYQGVEKGYAVLEGGGVGMIVTNDEITKAEIVAEAHVLPASQISASDGDTLHKYMISTGSPTAYINPPLTVLGNKPAPAMSSFSSQGPNGIIPEILKPDVTAPGVSVIAAYSRAASVSGLPFDHRQLLFNVATGTSMACPHISGIVALLKAVHSDWSSAAIRSAIMTTATIKDNMQQPLKTTLAGAATPFNYGAGHVRPNHAMDPGLVYDLTTDDYLDFICALGYDKPEVSNFTGGTYTCSSSKPLRLVDFNYPSIAIPNLSVSANTTRTLKNVGEPGIYKANVREPKGISVSVEPSSLNFEKVGEERTFAIHMEVKRSHIRGDYVFGRLTWSDGQHYVRSPLVVQVV